MKLQWYSFIRIIKHFSMERIIALGAFWGPVISELKQDYGNLSSAEILAA